MKKGIINVITIIICFVLQTTIFRFLSFGGIGPNLLIVMTSTLGFMRGKKTGTIVGFFSGLLVDIFFGEVIGVYALIYMYLGYANGLFKRIFYPEDIKLPIILITASDFLLGILTYFVLFVLRVRFQFTFYFKSIILPVIVYTIVVAIFLYPLILFLEKKLDSDTKKGANTFV